MVIVYLVISLIVFWVLYLAVMNLYRTYVAGNIPEVMLPLAYFVLGVGAGVDVLMNCTLFSVIFWERPRELLVTKRLKRHVRLGDGWRGRLALWICVNVLNPFDRTGNHCS